MLQILHNINDLPRSVKNMTSLNYCKNMTKHNIIIVFPEPKTLSLLKKSLAMFTIRMICHEQQSKSLGTHVLQCDP